MNRPSTSKRPTGASMKWDNSAKRSSLLNPGRKPLPEPSTISNTIVMLILHVCRKVVLMNPRFKVAIYFAFLFFGSVLCDAGFPFPKSYFSNKGNFLNQYFVKLGWGWTLSLTSAYIYYTSLIICAGDKRRIINHMLRMVVATAIWFFCTNFFVYVESRTGSCSMTKISQRTICMRKGHIWTGFDISGHCFLLIFCNLLINEECRSLQGWERIADILRNEDYDEDSPMKLLKDEERVALRINYPKYTPYVRGLFVVLTLLSILWDMMLVATVIYFHSTMQKVLGGVFAVLTWYFSYKFWFTSGLTPPAPGQGVFKYDIQPAKAAKK